MHEQRRKFKGPIERLTDAYRADPVRVIFWAVSLPVIALLVHYFLQSDWFN
jgi:hypothetical protein